MDNFLARGIQRAMAGRAPPFPIHQRHYRAAFSNQLDQAEYGCPAEAKLFGEMCNVSR